MSRSQLGLMWCIIVLTVVALLFMPRHENIVVPIKTKAMTPMKVANIQSYIGMELLIVGLFFVGGALTIRSGVKRARLASSDGDQIEPPQKDAKPATEEPLLVLTDERGRFVV